MEKETIATGEKEKMSAGMFCLAYILLAAAFGSCVYAIVCIIKGGFGALSPVTVIMELLTICVGFLYFLKGCTKDAAKYFRAIMLFAALSYLLDFIGLAIFPVMCTTDSMFYIEIVLTLLCYGNFMLLGASKDLGQKITFILLIINSCCCIYNLVTKLGAAPEVLAVNIEFVLVSFLSLIGARAKYIDKANRNTR